jgi:hypothetical protein
MTRRPAPRATALALPALAAALALAACATDPAAGKPSAPAARPPPPRPAGTADAAASAASREAFVRDLQRRFPADRYFVGFGESDRSAAEAETRARADAAASIRSTIRREVRAREEETTRGGKGEVSRVYVDEIATVVETDAGALIRARPEETRQVGELWRAVAVALRVDLDVRYADEARPVQARLARAYEGILAAPTWVAAAPAWCETASLETQLDARDRERKVVSGHGLWTPELSALRSRAHARRATAKQTLRVAVVRLADAPEADPSDAIVGGLRAGGWVASAHGPGACPDGGLVLEPALSRDCRHSSLGIEVCKVSLGIEARTCGEKAALFALFREAQATDSRDPDRAARNASKKLPVDGAAKEAVGRMLRTLGESCE